MDRFTALIDFNQEKALVGAFSVITNPRMELFEALAVYHSPAPRTARCPAPPPRGAARPRPRPPGHTP